MRMKFAGLSIISKGLMIALALALLCAAFGADAADKAEIKNIKYEKSSAGVQVIIELSGHPRFIQKSLDNPSRLFFDFKDSRRMSKVKSEILVSVPALKSIRTSQYDQRTVRIVFDLDEFQSYDVKKLDKPSRIVIDIKARPVNTAPAQQQPKSVAMADAPKADKAEAIKPDKAKSSNVDSSGAKVGASVATAKAAVTENTAKDAGADNASTAKADDCKADAASANPAAIQTDNTEAKTQPIENKSEAKSAPNSKTNARESETVSQKRKIVIDAGHGGKDPGAIGPDGLMEKDVVLDVAKRVKRQLEKQGFDVILTRGKDVYLDLDVRTQIANSRDADLFVSIHANANRNKRIKGIETYMLNWTDDEEAMNVAARENKITLKRMKETRTEIGMILASLELQNKRDESLMLAHSVQKGMISNVASKYDDIENNGVKQALFYVLVGAKMPSVLAEISYITNKAECKRLRSAAYKDQLAAGISAGIKQYFIESSTVQFAKR